MSVTYEHERPISTVDVVLLTARQRDAASAGTGDASRLEVVVATVRRREEPDAGAWGLPGTYLHAQADGDDTLEEAAQRALREKCGLPSTYVEQLRTYSGRKRDPRGWSQTTAFYALVHPSRLEGNPDILLRPVERLPELPFDHAEIIGDAVARVRSKATYSSMPSLLLDGTFTMPELEEAYHGLLGRRVDPSTFRRKIQGLKVATGGGETPYLVEAGFTQHRSKRPAALYRAAVDGVVYFPSRL